MNPILPRALHDRPSIGLFSPSEALNAARIARLQQNIRHLGPAFDFIFPENLTRSEHYMAGSVPERLADIADLLKEDIQALWATWGGKASIQLIQDFPYDQVAFLRPIILGFSDNAAFLNAIALKTGLITFYGPNVAGKMDESKHTNLGCLQVKEAPLVNPFGTTAGDLAKAINPGYAEGQLLGGNLSTFAATLPVLTAQGIQLPPKIVFFWEAASAKPAEIDQTLTSLRYQGFFGNVTAMIVGTLGMNDTKAAHDDELLSFSVRRPLNGLDIPIISCPTFGHGKLENPPIPVGARTSISATTKSVAIELLEDYLDRSALTRSDANDGE